VIVQSSSQTVTTTPGAKVKYKEHRVEEPLFPLMTQFIVLNIVKSWNVKREDFVNLTPDMLFRGLFIASNPKNLFGYPD
jgi:hypothetical protein